MGNGEQARPAYDERLSLPWWWWLAAAGFIGLMGAELYIGFGWVGALVAYVGLTVAIMALLLLLGRMRVQIADRELRAGRIRIPLAAIGSVRPLDRERRRLRMGRDADTRSVLATRPWIGTAIELSPAEPQDAPPYWLVSTRRPDVLSDVVRQAIGAPSQHGSM